MYYMYGGVNRFCAETTGRVVTVTSRSHSGFWFDPAYTIALLERFHNNKTCIYMYIYIGPIYVLCVYKHYVLYAAFMRRLLFI